ncbi:NAD(P)/FAD-dependent oxidoreductase [Marinobacter sp. JSM 1782161]|uniref:NAD(P)/FAD-dependent oxidoreductase n=1 Tax=Marinobacter sp. JSM 1782161 TaxID=2685906 RepID=UPI00140240E1|nr:NAD(P)/FAD-dependent oxidoreductase [Marinobacter sp. JSM 1782161]
MQADAIIVGGSFAGLSAAMQLARGQRPIMVIDAGQPRNRFADASHGFFGLDGATPAAIRSTALEQLGHYPTVRIIEGEATRADAQEGGFAVRLANGETATGGKLILATGLRDELPDLPGLAERWGKTVIHCPYCHGYEYRNRNLGVLATGPMSPHQASIIPDWGPTTYFTQGTFTPDDEQRALLERRGVTLETTPVAEVLGDAPAITGVRLADGRVIELEALFLGPRSHMASSLAEQLGCAFEEGPTGAVVQVDDFKQTSVPGVYAAGDMSNRMQNATFASASGVMAGVSTHRALMLET